MFFTFLESVTRDTPETHTLRHREGQLLISSLAAGDPTTMECLMLFTRHCTREISSRAVTSPCSGRLNNRRSWLADRRLYRQVVHLVEVLR